MICLNVLLLAKDAGDVPAIRDHLTRALRLSRTEPGCLRFDVYHSTAEPRRFVLVEHWASQQALDEPHIRQIGVFSPMEYPTAAQPVPIALRIASLAAQRPAKCSSERLRSWQ